MQPNWLPQNPQCRDEESSASLGLSCFFHGASRELCEQCPPADRVTVHIAWLCCAPRPKHSPTDFGSSESEYGPLQRPKHRLYRKKWL